MNCFEARKEFVSFWRRTLAPADSAALVAHLHGCVQCDRSFRVFALSAPVVHSDAEPEPGPRREALSVVRRQGYLAPRAAAAVRAPQPSRPWQIATAAMLTIIVGGVCAWSASPWPVRDFPEAFVREAVGVEPVSYTFGGPLFGSEGSEGEPSLFDPLASDRNSNASNDLAG